MIVAGPDESGHRAEIARLAEQLVYSAELRQKASPELAVALDVLRNDYDANNDEFQIERFQVKDVFGSATELGGTVAISANVGEGLMAATCWVAVTSILTTAGVTASATFAKASLRSSAGRTAS